jgi:hypothetical protein
VQVWVLNLNRPGNSLALWLALNAPDLFLWEWRRVHRALLRQGISAYGSGLGQSFDLTLDDEDTSDIDTSIGVDVATSADGVLEDDADNPAATLGIEPVDTSDLASDVANLVPIDSDIVTTAGDSAGSSGTTVAGAASSAGLSTANVIGAVGTALTSTQEISSLANAAAVYFANEAGSSALADVLGTQLATVAAGGTAQPLTTVTAPDGTTAPAAITTNPDGTSSVTPLTAAQLAALTPSSLSVFLAQYGVYLAVGGALAVGLAIVSRTHHGGYRR